MAFGTPVENSTFGQTSITVTGVPPGADILVFSYGQTTAPTAANDGNAYSVLTGAVVSSGYGAQAFLLQNASGGSHTINLTSANSIVYTVALWISGYGAATGTPTATDSNFAGTGTNAVAGAAVTPAVPNALLICDAGVVSGTASLAAGTGFTLLPTTYAGQGLEYQYLSSSAPVQGTFTASGNVDALVLTVALLPLAAPPPAGGGVFVEC
jgi:hypothetical protein